MEFLVIGKRVVILHRDADPPRASQTRHWNEHETHTRITCPPRSLTGAGAEVVLETAGVNTLMELETTSSGGRLQCLSGATVWRTVSDFGRLVRYVAKAVFHDGRPVCLVLPQLGIPTYGPIVQMLTADGRGDLDKVTQRMMSDVRFYVKSLVGAAERNELPVCVLRCLLSFLGSPPGGAGEPPEPHHSPMAVWLTMSRLRELRQDTGLGGHARKRHHTSECAGVPLSVPVRPRRRHLTAPADPSRALLTCRELSLLSPLPAAADHPLDRHMAARTVRFCCRPAVVEWHGSEFTNLWRQEVAQQAHCRLLVRVAENGIKSLKKEMLQRYWKKEQQQRLLRQKRQQRQPKQQQERRQQQPSLLRQSVANFLGLTSTSRMLQNNMLIFPPPPKKKEGPASGQRQQPRLKFGPSQRPSLKQKKLSQILQNEQLQGQQSEPQVRDQTSTSHGKQEDSGKKPLSTARLALASSHQKNQQTSSSRLKDAPSSGEPQPSHRRVLSPESSGPRRQPRTSQSPSQLHAGAAAPEPGQSSDGRPPRLSLPEHRIHLFITHNQFLRRGRRPRQVPDTPLPPRSPLAGPSVSPSQLPISLQVARPGLWRRLRGPPRSALQQIPQQTPQQTQRKTIRPVTQQTPRQTQWQTQRRPQCLQCPPPPARSSLWSRLTRMLGPDSTTSQATHIELAQEATEACILAILEYQRTLPIVFRMLGREC